MGFGGDLGSQLLYGTLGGAFSLTVPTLAERFMSGVNSGWTGYGLNFLAAWGGSRLLSGVLGPKKAQDFMVGGFIATGLRILNSFLGSSSIGLSGLGFYIPNSFPLPTTGSGPFLLNSGYEGGSPMPSVQAGATPAALAAAAMPSSGADEPARWGKWAA